MSHQRGFHIRGLYACLNLMHTGASVKPAIPRVCCCGAKAPLPHSVNCIVHLSEFADVTFTVAILQDYYDMGWQLEEMPPLLKAKPGVAFAMGRDCRMSRITENPILDVEPAALPLLPVHA